MTYSLVMPLPLLTRAVVEHARRNGCVITTPEARRLGAGSRQMAALVEAGVIGRRHPGVYVLARAGADPLVEVRAALTAVRMRRPEQCAAASHGSAAWLQGLLDQAPWEVHVTTTGRHDRRLEGVVVHKATPAAGGPGGRFETRRFRGVLCTVPARTLLDLAATAAPLELADAVDRALAARIVRARDLVAETRRAGRRRGAERLRRCLYERGDTGVPAPSVLESRMGRLLRRHGLPEPRAEVIAGPNGEYRIDYAYVRQRLAIELYGYTWHHSPEQMAHDLARQRRLALEGWTVLIFTWRDLETQPDRVADQIREALSASSVR